MRKYLSIIIPHYRETEQEVFPLLSSINNQLTVDWSSVETIIVTDGGGIVLDEGFLRLFRNLEIRQINLETNAGPGLARQAGIDAAKGEYLMFCDADDVLQNVGVISTVLQSAEKDAPDILTTKWLEEVRAQDGSLGYMAHSDEATWMHGKLIRRNYLIQNGIRHHPDLKIHEDSYFLSLAFAKTDRVINSDLISYVWIYRGESITRKDERAYSFDSIPTYIYAQCEADKEVERLNPQIMEFRICQFVVYMFFTLHKPEWLEKPERIRESEKALIDNMVPYWHYWDGADIGFKAQIYNDERGRSFLGCVENETLNEWLGRIRSFKNTEEGE